MERPRRRRRRQGLPLRQARRLRDRPRGSGRRQSATASYIPQTGLVPPVFAGWERAAGADVRPPGASLRRGRQPAADACVTRRRPRGARRRVHAAGLRRGGHRPSTAGARPLGRVRGPCSRRAACSRLLPHGLAGRLPLRTDNFLYEPFLSSLSPYTLGTRYSDADVDRLLTLARSTADPAGAPRPQQARGARDPRRQARAAALPVRRLPPAELRIGGFSVSPIYGVDAWKLWVQ